MKGVVFNVFEDAVRRVHGDVVWDDILDRAGLQGAYTSLDTYSDCDLMRLVTAAADILNVGEDELVEWLGVEAAGIFFRRYPGFFAPYKTTAAFVAALNDIIHPEVKKLYPAAETPHFEIEMRPGNVLVMHYHSRRSLCRLAAGLVVGSAPRFGECATVQHTACKRDGDDHCILLIHLERMEVAHGGR